MRTILALLFISAAILLVLKLIRVPITSTKPKKENAEKNISSEKDESVDKMLLKKKAAALKAFAKNKGYSTQYALLANMQMHSGKKRLFVYDLKKDSIVAAGLMAHGSCNTTFLLSAKFSNTPNCGCSSLGKYKIDYKYNGQFGTAFKLRGLDESNSNAFGRFIVLHAYDCVPDKETYPFPICNSLGCPMVSYAFLSKLENVIKKSDKHLLLYMFN